MLNNPLKLNLHMMNRLKQNQYLRESDFPEGDGLNMVGFLLIILHCFEVPDLPKRTILADPDI